MWSTPRLHGTTLSASWQVRPEEATCYYDLLDADGGQAGSGLAETSQEGATGRGIQVEYDPDTADALDSVEIRCSLLGGETAVSEFQIYRVNYKNRHPDSVLPADDEHYFDHGEISALFGECAPEGRRRTRVSVPPNLAGEISDMDGNGTVDYNDYLYARLDFWMEVFANWDTEVTEVDGHEVVSGWWTTRQMRMYYPKSSITAASARQHAAYDDSDGYLSLLPDGLPMEAYEVSIWVEYPYRHSYEDGSYYYFLESLYKRLEDSVPDYASSEYWELRQWVTDTGIVGAEKNGRGVFPNELLLDWMDTRHGFAPIDREPTAWAMRTLLEARGASCVATEMRAHCESGEFHPSRHMRHPDQGGSRLGSVLWSAICPEVSPNAP